MNLFLRFFLVAAGAWGTSFILSLLLIGVVAASTQRWPAGRMQIVVPILLGIIALLFIVSIFFVRSMGKRIFSEQFHWLFIALYASGALITLLTLAIVALVTLNR